EVLGTGVMGGVEADLGQVGDVHVGDHHGGGTLDLRGCFDRLGDRVLEVGDVLGALLGQSQTLAVVFDHLPPGRGPCGFGISHGGGDLGEQVVVLLGQPGIGGQDDVGSGVGDGFEIDAVGLIEQGGLVTAEFGQLVRDPGVDAIAVVVAPHGLRHAYRDDAQGQWYLVVAPVHGRHSLGLGLDDRLAEGVVDLHGPAALAGA